MKDIKKLTVKYNGTIVGYLAYVGNKLAFQYDDNWIANGFSISPLSLPLSNKVYYPQDNTFHGLFGVFHDSLPDGWGEVLVRRTLREKGIEYDKLNALQRLMLINKDGLGALTYEPNEPFENKKINFDIDELAKSAANIYDDHVTTANLDWVYIFGGSSAGARPKAHLSANNDYYIVKFLCHDDSKDVGLQEYKANMLAKQCGININECTIFDSKLCKGYFAAKRFDRDKDGQRIHMISLSSLLETTHRIPNLDYRHLFQVIQNFCKSKEDLYEAYRRMCFNVLYGNLDDHGRNFAFLYDEKLKSYKLSPAFDITKSNTGIEHEMTVCGNGRPTEKDLLKLATEMHLPLEKCQKIINKVKEVIKIQ